MERAIALAERGRGIVSPNPLVGAVAVREGRVVGEGWHEGPGTAHAEVVALRAAGDRSRGATLYTTLEPCNRSGRTPPCTTAMIGAGVTRVVIGALDPNLGAGEPGVHELRMAGIEVEPGIWSAEAERQNAAFLKHVRTGLPLVTMKMAASLDGKVAARDGSSRWITGAEARADVHRLRAASDAIVVGAGTALADDPSLTVREPGYRGAPVLRVLVDARGRVPAAGDLFDDAAPTLVAATDLAPAERVEEWRAAGAEVLEYGFDGRGVPLDSLLADLGKRDVQGVLLEGGPTLAWTAVRDGLVDRVVVYLAPILVGGTGAPGILGGDGFGPIGAAERVRITSFCRIGDDLRVEADVHRDR